MEIWRDIKGFEGLYQVSNKGNVKSLSRPSWNRFKFVQTKETILKPSKGEYLRVKLYDKNNKSKNFAVHRLVCLTFLERIKGKNFVNHKNGDKYDNRLENLEWCTKSENTLHSFRNGFQTPIVGSNHSNSKLDESKAKKIKYGHSDLTQSQIAKIYGIDRSKVYQIRKGISCKHI